MPKETAVPVAVFVAISVQWIKSKEASTIYVVLGFTDIPASGRRIEAKLRLFVLGRDGLRFAFQGRHQGVPGQNGALDASGEFVDAREDREFANVGHGLPSGDHFMDLGKHFPGFRFRFAF